MGGKRSLSDEEVGVAVDALLTSFGLPDDGTAVDDTGFDLEASQPTLADGEKGGMAPSAEVGALWGTPKPRKK